MSDASARAVAIDEPRQGGAVALEIVTHAIQPFALRRADQPLRGERRLRRCNSATSPSMASSRSPAAVSSRAAYARTVSSMLVQRTRRHCRGLGSQQETLVDQAGRRAERFVAPGRGILTTGKNRRGCVDRKPARQRAEAAEGALLGGAKQLITPGDGRIHRLLAFGEIARPDGREQHIVLESAEQILGASAL